MLEFIDINRAKKLIAHDEDVCPQCKKVFIPHLFDSDSIREYLVSGLCRYCQLKIFGNYTPGRVYQRTDNEQQILYKQALTLYKSTNSWRQVAFQLGISPQYLHELKKKFDPEFIPRPKRKSSLSANLRE